jgi:hypothetical protein
LKLDYFSFLKSAETSQMNLNRLVSRKKNLNFLSETACSSLFSLISLVNLKTKMICLFEALGRLNFNSLNPPIHQGIFLTFEVWNNLLEQVSDFSSPLVS